MFTLISHQEHIVPTRSCEEQRFLVLQPSNPHYTFPLAHLQLRIECRDFERHTAIWPWIQLFPINRVLYLEVAREGMSQTKLKGESLSVRLPHVAEASPERSTFNGIC